jgi:hypothetical protein
MKRSSQCMITYVCKVVQLSENVFDEQSYSQHFSCTPPYKNTRAKLVCIISGQAWSMHIQLLVSVATSHRYACLFYVSAACRRCV